MSNLTPWFPTDVKPVRVGVYETRFQLQVADWSFGYSYWDGTRWANAAGSVDSAHAIRDWFDGAIQEKQWRGLTQEAA